LKLHQCGLPKKMALELFKPFIYSKLDLYGIATTLKAAKRMVELEHPDVWDILEGVIREHPVLLNRAPTLHRLGIQAFEPLLIEGKAIQLHPLVCAAFNADFDGDQMAVHIPLSIEAQLEARVLMMSTNNILSPANGKPIIVPSQDMILGLYYMSLQFDGENGEGSIISNIGELEHAIHSERVSLHAKIKCRRSRIDIEGNVISFIADTTPGRVLISEILPKDSNISFDFVNKVMNKKDVSALIDVVYRYCGQKSTVIFADHLMQLGFTYAMKSGISIGKDDMIVPETKPKHVSESMIEVAQYENQYADGLITSGEKYNKIVDVWSRCTDKIAVDMMKMISGGANKNINKKNANSIYMMADSGARGSATQIKQISGMRGLMTKPSGEIIETPIISNFKEGLSELEFFTSTHGARKGLADTALKTANSGYLTRKLVDVAQDCVVIEEDCGTSRGVVMQMIVESGEVIVPLADLILGRVSIAAIYHPITGKLIIDKNKLIDESIVDEIEEVGVDSVKVRSILTCETKGGVCAHCYGRDLSTGRLVSNGEAIGVIAAQSIGEPGTQLTMRTFHIGGAAQKTTVQSSAITSYAGIMKLVHKNLVVDSSGKNILMSRNCEAVILDINNIERARYKVPYGARLLIEDGESVKPGDKIAEWDPFTVPIIVEKSGKASFVDLVEGVSFKEMQDENTGITNLVITDSKKYVKGEELRPRVILLDDSGQVMTLANSLEARYFLPVGAILNISNKFHVHAGDVIARIPKESSKSRDITGGLPRVIELVEARQPKDHSIISEIDGYVEYGKDYKSKRRIIIKPIIETEHAIEYLVPRGRHVTVNEGDYVSKGDMLMEGNPSPHDILRIMGIEALAKYMIQEVQQVYRLQGVLINDKHIEVILRQMLQKVEIVDAGETTFLVGEQVDREEFEEVNAKAAKENYSVAMAIPVLQGITRASLQTRSFFSAASFQETTRVLTEAAIAGKIDNLVGLKENVIVGRLIPAGTGLYWKRMKKLAHMRDKEIKNVDSNA